MQQGAPDIAGIGLVNFQLRQQLRYGFVEGCSRKYNKNFANPGGEVELCKGLELTAALRTLGDVSRPDLLAAISANLRNNLEGIQCENPVIKLLADHFARCGNDGHVDEASPDDELGATQSFYSSTRQRVVFGGTRSAPPASSSPPPTDFVIRVAFSSAGRQQTYRFDAKMVQEEPHLMWLYLAPLRVPEERKGCVTISFDPKPTRQSLREDVGKQAILQSLYFDGRCSVADDPPLDPKHGTRAMLSGAVHVFRHLVRTWWPHVTELHLADESTYKCEPRFGNKIRTYATDLLTGDLTYYERHLGASPTMSRVRQRRSEVRRRITAPVDATGEAFWAAMAAPPTPWDRRQERWMAAHGDEVMELLDSTRETGKTWQDFFEEVRARYGCDLYACCADQLVTFFGMSRLTGASYSVVLDDLRGASSVVVQGSLRDEESGKGRTLDAMVQVGGGAAIRGASREVRLRRVASAVMGSLYAGRAIRSRAMAQEASRSGGLETPVERAEPRELPVASEEARRSHVDVVDGPRLPAVPVDELHAVEGGQDAPHELVDGAGLPDRAGELGDPQGLPVRRVVRADVADEPVGVGPSVPVHRHEVDAEPELGGASHELGQPAVAPRARRGAEEASPGGGQRRPTPQRLVDRHVALRRHVRLVEPQEVIASERGALPAPRHRHELRPRDAGRRGSAPVVVPRRADGADLLGRGGVVPRARDPSLGTGRVRPRSHNHSRFRAA